MAKINSMVARFSGIATYSDNTTQSFHVQYDAGQSWSFDTAESQEALRRLSWYYDYNVGDWIYWDAIGTALDAPPALYVTWDTNLPITYKNVTDMSARVEYIVTTDDNHEYQMSVVLAGTSELVRIYAGTNLGIYSVTNAAEYKAILHTMFHKVMDSVTVT